MRIDRGRLGWGVFFLTLGLVPLAIRLGWVDPAWFEGIWRLWPLILVGIGIGLILRRTALAAIGNVIVGLTFGLIIGGALATPIQHTASRVHPDRRHRRRTDDADRHVHGHDGRGQGRLPLRRRRRRDHRGRRLDGGRDGRSRHDQDRHLGRCREPGRSIAPGAPAIWNQGKDAHVQVDLPTSPEMGLDIDAWPAAWPPTRAARGWSDLSPLSVSAARGLPPAQARGRHQRQPVLSVNAGSADISLPASPFDGSASVNAEGRLQPVRSGGDGDPRHLELGAQSVDVGPGFTREGAQASDECLDRRRRRVGAAFERGPRIRRRIRSGGCQ